MWKARSDLSNKLLGLFRTMYKFKLFMIFSWLIMPLSYASCGLPQLITGAEQSVLLGEIKLDYIDKDLLGSEGVDLLYIEIPNIYKDLEIRKALLTYWKGDKVASHVNLGAVYKPIRTPERTKVFEFTVNRFSGEIPIFTFIYGDKCYSRHRLNITNIMDYHIDFDEKWEWSVEKQNSIFKKLVTNNPNKSLKREN